MKYLMLASVLGSLFNTASSNGATVPLYTVKIGMEENSKMPAWLLEFHAPANHHFNLKAPMTVKAGDIPFVKVGMNDHTIGFRASNPKLKEGLELESALFLCDDAKTFCVSQKQKLILKVNSDLKWLSADQAPNSSRVPSTRKINKTIKDEHGFWNNDVNSALKESAMTRKPLFIDFYAIWCPPCNQFTESVFNTAKFKSIAKNWVLLKLDVDQEASFSLKSQFKVGSYPTIILTKASNAGNTLKDLIEVDRIVGFFPISDFSDKLNQAYTSRNISLDERLNVKKELFVSEARKVIDIKFEKKEFKEVMGLLDQGLALVPNDHSFLLTRLFILAKENRALLKEDSTLALMNAIHQDREVETTDTLIRAEDFLTSQADAFKKEQVAQANDFLDVLATRIDLKTLFVTGSELSLADIDSARVDVAEALKDEVLVKTSHLRAIKSYQALMKLNPGESRGLSLELAYHLWKSGDSLQAKKIYDSFIAKYPSEFTFYFAASRMYLELKDFKTARELAERALQYSYGDNQIRSMERVLRVMGLQGEKTYALERGKKYLETAKGAPDLNVRSDRYLQTVRKTLIDIETGKL